MIENSFDLNHSEIANLSKAILNKEETGSNDIEYLAGLIGKTTAFVCIYLEFKMRTKGKKDPNDVLQFLGNLTENQLEYQASQEPKSVN